MDLKNKKIFNENGDIELSKRRIIKGNTTNLNDFNNLKYTWVSDWYRQAMNNFWIPEEISLVEDKLCYKTLKKEEFDTYNKILSFLIFLDSVQTANIPLLTRYISANEINLCLNIQTYQEAVHSQSYGYILDSICSANERDEILYQWKDDPVLLERNKFIGSIYEGFNDERNENNFVRSLIGNFILEGIYFYSGFMFFYNLQRNGKMSGTAQEIRYINRDENTHLWLYRNLIVDIMKEEPQLFTPELIDEYRNMIKEGCLMEIKWAEYVIGDKIQGLNIQMITDYIMYLGNFRCRSLGFEYIFEGHTREPESMKWVSLYSNPNELKTDFFEGKVSAYSKSSAFVDDL